VAPDATSFVDDLGRRLEVRLDGRLGSAGHEHHVVDPGAGGLVDDQLQRRDVADRQQLLGNGLREREEPGPQAGGGDDGGTHVHVSTLEPGYGLALDGHDVR
jgi:hypothetical protein